MQMVKKLLLGFLIVWIALFVFMPKEELYFSLERVLVKQGVEINEAAIEENLFGLTLKDAVVYVKGIRIATVQEISFSTLLFYTKVEATGLAVDEGLKTMMPERAESIIVTHSILHPMRLSISAEGSFGKAEGTLSITQRTLHVDFTETKDIEAILPQLKQGEKGWYYETAF